MTDCSEVHLNGVGLECMAEVGCKQVDGVLGSWQGGGRCRVYFRRCSTSGFQPCRWLMLKGPRLCAGGASGAFLELFQYVGHWCWLLVGLESKGKET